MNITLIGVPLFYGSDKEGVDLAPDKLREKNILGIIEKYHNTVYDFGNLFIRKVLANDKFSFHPKLKYLKPIVEVTTNLAEEVYSSLSAGDFPFIIGGDHSLGLGSIRGASKFFDNLAVIWVDAHGDINTDETSFTGNVHGMPLAAAMGIGPSDLTNIYADGHKIKPENVFLIGARDLDNGEIDLINKTKMHVYSTKDIYNRGIENILDEVSKILISNNIKAVHLSFDIDCIDPEYVPGTGTPVPDGMTLEQAKYLLKYLMNTKLVKSMDLVELNPLLDKEDKTTNLVVDLIDCTFKNMN